MIVNQAKKIIEDSQKIYQFATKKIVVNIFYIIFAILAVISLIMLILALTLASNKVITPLLWTAVAVLIFCLVAFYVFEYIRRRAIHYYETQFSFQKLYEHNLISQKRIDDRLNAINSENSEFLKIHMDLMAKNYGEFANLANQFETYSYYHNHQNYLLSLAIVKDYGKKITKLNENLQMIISSNCDFDFDLYLSKKIENNTNTVLQYQLADTIDGINVYANLQDYAKQSIPKIDQYLKLIKNCNNDGIDIDIWLKKTKIFILTTFKNNQLLLNYKGIKTFRDDLTSITQKYDANFTLIDDLFKLL